MTQEHVIDAKELARECVEKVMPDADGEYKEQLIQCCVDYLRIVASAHFTKQ
jgi:hypothetical protein